MKFCSHCGAEIDDNAVTCVKCGCQVAQITTTAVTSNDKPSGGFAFLGFLFPLVGLILFLVWNNTYPKKARSCGKGALVGVIIYIISVAIIAVINTNVLNNISFPSSSKSVQAIYKTNFEPYDENKKLSKSKARQLTLETLKAIAAEPSSVKIIAVNEPKYHKDYGYIFQVEFTWTGMYGVPAHERWWWYAKNPTSVLIMDDQSEASKIYYRIR